jgi:hypothetical protein
MAFNATFNNIASTKMYIVAASFIGGRNRSTRREPPTCHKSLTNFASSTPRHERGSNSKMRTISERSSVIWIVVMIRVFVAYDGILHQSDRFETSIFIPLYQMKI